VGRFRGTRSRKWGVVIEGEADGCDELMLVKPDNAHVDV
jgi:hypothetical protein